MKKNLTKKLMLSVLTLAFAVVSLGASTFAWFTTSENAEVEQITYDVTSDAGLEVAVAKVDGTMISNYYIGALPQDQIETVVAAHGFKTFNNVSYYDGVSASANFVANKFYNKTTTAGVAGDDATDDENKGYIAFQLNVRVDQTGWIKLNVPYLTSQGAAAWVAGVNYTANNDVTVLPTTPMTYDVLSASRLAVVPSENVKDAQDGNALALGFYEAKAEAATVAEAQTDAEGNVTQAAASVGNTAGLSEKGAWEIYNAKYDGTTSDIPAFPEGFTQTAATQVAAGESNSFVFYAAAGEIYEFDIYIWIEGYDAECANAIFSQKLSAAFSFQYAAPDKKDSLTA